jgi:hypothetical protein
MLKVSTFASENELGYTAVPLFGPADGEFEKNASASLLPPVLQYIETLRPKKDSQYVLVNALAAGEYFGCFPAGTLVETDTGEQPIEEVEPGALVRTHLNRHQKVLARIPKQADELCDLYVQGFPSNLPSLTATPNHELWVVTRQDFVQTKRRVVWKGDTSTSVEQRREQALKEMEFSWVPIGSLQPGDYIAEPFPLDEDPAALGDEKWNCPEVAFLMGLYAAEGCTVTRAERPGENHYVVYVTSSEEEQVIQRAAQHAEKFGYSLYTDRSKVTSIRAELHWQDFARLCYEHVGKLGPHKKLSAALTRMPRGWQRVFLAAYAAGDGCVRQGGKEDGSQRMVSASAALLRGMRLILARCGLVGSISGRHNKKATWYNGSPIYELSVSGGQLKGRGTPKSYLHPDGYILSAVKRVEQYAWQGEVYDLTVEEDSSFVASGICVHNSNINGDFFPEAALIHAPSGWTNNPVVDKALAKDWPYGFPTFYNAHPYAHHRNKDPSRAYGEVELALWNDQMKRVELVVRVDYDKCVQFGGVPVWDKLVKGQFPDVSMGSKVPYDTSSITLDWELYRKAQETFDPKKHKHPGIAVLEFHKKLKKKDGKGIPGVSITRDDYDEYCTKHMNRILPDGRKVFVYNDYPRFFDISFVFIGADRTAKTLVYIHQTKDKPSVKIAEAGEKVASVQQKCLNAVMDLAEANPGLTVMTGPADKKYDTRHFWAVDKKGKVHDPTRSDYKHYSQGKPLDMAANAEALGEIRKTAAIPEENFVSALIKGAEQRKRAEIEKEVVPSQLASKAIPVLTKTESDLPDELINAMAAKPLDEALSTSSGLCMVIKPREFQRIVLIRAGKKPLADALDDRGILFPKTEERDESLQLSEEKVLPALAKALMPMFDMRSAMAPAIERRVVIAFNPSMGDVTPTSLPSEDLRKIGAAYSAYRNQLIDMAPHAQDLITKTASSKDVELMKVASADADDIFTHLSFLYMRDAYLDELPLGDETESMVQLS